MTEIEEITEKVRMNNMKEEKKEVRTCYFCGVTTTLLEVTIDGKRYDACEECIPNIFRTLDLLKIKYQTEIQNQILIRQENFVNKMIKEQISERETENDRN